MKPPMCKNKGHLNSSPKPGDTNQVGCLGVFPDEILSVTHIISCILVIFFNAPICAFYAVLCWSQDECKANKESKRVSVGIKNCISF